MIQKVTTPVLRGIIHIATHRKTKMVGRAATTMVCWGGPFVAGGVLYQTKVLPSFNEAVDWSRDFLKQLPLLYEGLTSAFLLGFLPDRAAQKVEGGNFSWKRSGLMSLQGAVSGAIFIRLLYDGLDTMIPGKELGKDLWPLAQKALITQGNYSPAYLAIFFSYTNLIQGKPWEGFGARLRTFLVKKLPVNWCFWIPLSALIYALPSDLMVYTASLASVVWYTALSKWTHE